MDGVRRVRALLIASAFAGLAPVAAFACTPPLNWTPERQAAWDDEELLQANFIFRGVIENPTAEYDPPADLSRMLIRRTRLFWGVGAPETVSISEAEGYYSRCARGNLHPATQFSGEPGWPEIRHGLGVTVIGRIGDEAPNLFILVDGAPGTEETLRRFERNLRNLER